WERRGHREAAPLPSEYLARVDRNLPRRGLERRRLAQTRTCVVRLTSHAPRLPARRAWRQSRLVRNWRLVVVSHCLKEDRPGPPKSRYSNPAGEVVVTGPAANLFAWS